MPRHLLRSSSNKPSHHVCDLAPNWVFQSLIRSRLRKKSYLAPGCYGPLQQGSTAVALQAGQIAFSQEAKRKEHSFLLRISAQDVVPLTMGGSAYLNYLSQNNLPWACLEIPILDDSRSPFDN